MVDLLRHEEIEPIYESFIEKNGIVQEKCIRPRSIPFLDHDVFGKWILRKTKPLTIFIAEAPPWSYSDQSKKPYFYSEEYNKNCVRDMTRILLDSLDIRGSSKKERLELFKKEGYLLLDAIKCPVDVEYLREASKMHSLLRDSGKKILAKELQYLAAEEQLRCIVALGGSSRIALKAGISCKGLPRNRMKKWIQDFDKDKNPIYRVILSSSVTVPVLPWIFPSPWNDEGKHFAECRMKKAIEKYLEKYEQDMRSRQKA